MSDQQLRRFIMHYERITRRMLEELPGRADIVLRMGSNQRIEICELKMDRATCAFAPDGRVVRGM